MMRALMICLLLMGCASQVEQACRQQLGREPNASLGMFGPIVLFAYPLIESQPENKEYWKRMEACEAQYNAVRQANQ